MLTCVLILAFQLKDEIRYYKVTGMQSSFFFFSSRRRHTRLQGDWSSDVCSSDLSTIPATVAYWADVGWDILLIGSSMGTNSIFFFFLFFAILVASFQAGFTAGMRVTLVATVLFTGVGFAMAPAEPEFELNGFLLRPTSLLVLGYMIACWGGAETMFRRRLALLKDVSVLANPRFGVDRTFGALMERLRAFYAADMGMLVMAEPPPGGYTLRRVSRQHPATAGMAEVITAEVARVLLALPATQ